MTIPREWEGTPLERVEDLPRILRAMAEAVREALLTHKRLGNPVAVWHEGRVVWLAPEEIPVEDVPGGGGPGGGVVGTPSPVGQETPRP